MTGRACAAAVATVLGLVAAAGCSTEPSDAGQPSPAQRLAAARAALDDTPAVTVELTGEDLPTTGTVLVGASGTAAHPSSFEGEVRVSRDGLAATVPLVSVDGSVWAQLPFSTGFTAVDPAALGVGDPGALIDPEGGVSALLVADPQPTELGQVRLGQEVLREYEAQLPGDLVGALLTIADPDATVSARFGLAPGSDELRRAVLTGPFYAGAADQTYTLVVDGYGTAAQIRAPSAG